MRRFTLIATLVSIVTLFLVYYFNTLFMVVLTGLYTLGVFSSQFTNYIIDFE